MNKSPSTTNRGTVTVSALATGSASGTPRTDAQCIEPAAEGSMTPCDPKYQHACVRASFARELERELAAAKRNAAEWERIAMSAGNDAQAMRRRLHLAGLSPNNVIGHK